MNPALQPSTPSKTLDPSEVSFGRSADGMPVALVAENAYAMAPGRNGGHYLAYGRRIAQPMTEWTRSDFYGHGGDLANQAAFRAKMIE